MTSILVVIAVVVFLGLEFMNFCYLTLERVERQRLFAAMQEGAERYCDFLQKKIDETKDIPEEVENKEVKE
jgi:hypothetical protein